LKARAVTELSSAVAAGPLELESFTALDGDVVLERLYALQGVGRWSAEYVLLRGLERLHVFPGDVGAQNKIQEYLGLGSCRIMRQCVGDSRGGGLVTSKR
jgi:DNA-3-methyladenine glycosylase II